MMHGRGRLDAAIVAVKPTNKAERSAAEPVEPRAATEGNAIQQSTCRAQSRESVSQALERIRKVAKEKKEERFTALFHHLSIEHIEEFQHEDDARRFWSELRERLQEFALSLHPEKTRLIEFGRFAAKNRKERGLGKPETFNFLGFTFICGKSRRGKFLAKRKTRRDRMRAKLKMIAEELRQRMHQPIPQLGKWLGRVVQGYFNYHAVPTNSRALVAFRDEITRRWQRALSRRSDKGDVTWARIKKLADDWLPRPHIRHPWPAQRFAVRYPR